MFATARREPVFISGLGAGAQRGQLAEFRYNKQIGVSVWITVHFLFGADEQTLHIESIEVEFGA